MTTVKNQCYIFRQVCHRKARRFDANRRELICPPVLKEKTIDPAEAEAISENRKSQSAPTGVIWLFCIKSSMHDDNYEQSATELDL